jgi:hypothetical protein
MAMMRRGLLTILAAVACLVPMAPAALAAAPASDDFADREVLSGSLPIQVTRSNVEATREEGEPFLMTGKGRTIWYEWEAEDTGFVTVGTCEAGFRALVGVFTGTAVNTLTAVADTSSNGPGCPTPYSGTQATFKAQAGTVYEIVADGDGFYLPPSPPPSGEGLIPLQIEATPPPANDDFENAAALSGSIEEEPGEPPWYFGAATGYNWGASKQLGEPEHAGDPGGASVWYRWTPPVAGVARFSAQGNWFKTLISVYEGSSLGALTELASGEFLGIDGVPVTAGKTYWIAIDGKRDSGSGEASTAQFWLYVMMNNLQLPSQRPSTPAPQPTTADTTPPETSLHRISVAKRRVLAPDMKAFAFVSSETPSTFRCRLDGRPLTVCNPPKTYRNLKSGRHKFEVFAIDAAGNADPTPAKTRFRIPKVLPPLPEVKG